MRIEKRMRIPNGKLLVMKADIVNNKVKKVSLQGDFFFFPENKLGLVENALHSTPFSELPKTLKSIINQNHLSLCGITIEGICQGMESIYNELETKK